MADLENLKSNETIPWDIDFGNTIGELDKLEWDDPELEKAKRIIEEWWDTNQITKLTAELIDDKFAELVGGRIGLAWLRNLDKETAAKLVDLGGRSIDFFWLTNLDEGTAAELAKFDGEELGLWWLTNINQWVAEELARFQWDYLDLNWLEDINEDVAIALSQIKDKLIVSSDVMDKIEEVLIKKEEIEKDITDSIINGIREPEQAKKDNFQLTVDGQNTLWGWVKNYLESNYSGQKFDINGICNSIMENNGIKNAQTIPNGTALNVSVTRDIIPNAR